MEVRRLALVALGAVHLVAPLGAVHLHQRPRLMGGCRWEPLVPVCRRSVAVACLKAPVIQVGSGADQLFLYERRQLCREVRNDHYLHYSRSQCVD